MNNEYFKILFAQLKVSLDYNKNNEYLIENKSYFFQMDKIIDEIKQSDPDIIIIPELCYHKKYDDYFKTNSINKIVVFGSTYIGSENFTIVYSNNNKYVIKKMFQSGVEPSVRFQTPISTSTFIKKHLKERTFKLKSKKFIILNCAEYYKCAYYIARNKNLNKNLFGFLVPCANNNKDVFLTESKAFHNHNQDVYSFVVNSISNYKNKAYSNGESYVLGKVSQFEKEFVDKNKINHSSIICELNNLPSVVCGEFLFSNSSNYYRSDNYKHTPLNLKIKKIGE